MAKKNEPYLDEDDRAFFMNAYKNNPKARKSMDAEFKRMGITAEEYFGIKKKPEKK